MDSLEIPACRDGLGAIWKLWTNSRPDLDGLERFTHTLAECRAFLLSFGKMQARSKRSRMWRLRSLVRRFSLAAKREAADYSLFYAQEEARCQLEEFEVEEARRWKIRAGARWAADGDHPTAFFFLQFKERRLARTIEGLKTPEGVTVSSPDALQDVLVTAFESLY